MLRGAADAGTTERCIKFVWPVLSFGAGAIAAAFAYHAIGFAGLIVPVLILVAMVVWEFRQPLPAKAAAS